MERKCKRCKSVEIIDDFHDICYECFVELDLEEHERELMEGLSPCPAQRSESTQSKKGEEE